jgi:hypothetical protein
MSRHEDADAAPTERPLLPASGRPRRMLLQGARSGRIFGKPDTPADAPGPRRAGAKQLACRPGPSHP